MPVVATAVAWEGGTVDGTTNKVNAAEVDAVDEQLEKCLADPR